MLITFCGYIFLFGSTFQTPALLCLHGLHIPNFAEKAESERKKKGISVGKGEEEGSCSYNRKPSALSRSLQVKTYMLMLVLCVHFT